MVACLGVPYYRTLFYYVILRSAREAVKVIPGRREEAGGDVPQYDAAVRDPLRRCGGGAGPRLAPHRERDRGPVRQAGGGGAVPLGGAAGGRRRRQVRPRVRAGAGRQGAARVRRAG